MNASLLKLREVAATLNVSYNSVLRAVKSGKLRAYRFGPRGGTYRVDPADLEEYLARSRVPANEVREVAADARKGKTVGIFTHLNADRLISAWGTKSTKPGSEVT